MARAPRVSVVVPLYNKGRFVRRALQSISNQSFGDFEIIVVDDGSTDDGRRLASDYDDERVLVVTQGNAGPGAARNRGISQAKGELLAFLDADDEWYPSYLEDSVRLLDESRPRIASLTSNAAVYRTGREAQGVWRRGQLPDGPQRVGPQTAAAEVVTWLASINPSFTVIRADAIARWGGFYERERCLYGEDTYLFLKLLLNETVAFSGEERGRFYADASQLSRNYAGPRPVEPFLTRPYEVEAACPPVLRDLLARVLEIRAYKTACMLGYWGQWRDARALAERFAVSDWRTPYFVPARVCASPAGALLGAGLRALRVPAREGVKR